MLIDLSIHQFISIYAIAGACWVACDKLWMMVCLLQFYHLKSR